MNKHLKRFFGFIFAFSLILMSVISVIPVNADSISYIEYDEYNYIVYIVEENNDYTAYILAHINDNFLEYVDTADPYYQDSLSSNGVFLVNASISSYQDQYYYAELVISQAILWQVYINTATLAKYNQGYTDGSQAENSVIYGIGFDDGVDSVKDPANPLYQEIFVKGQEYEDQYYEEGQQGYDSIYDRGYNDGAQSILDTIGDEDNPSFLVMFKVIINYIRDFFLVGMNVEIFGINIGNFCLGIFMLSIFMMILNIFRR